MRPVQQKRPVQQMSTVLRIRPILRMCLIHQMHCPADAPRSADAPCPAVDRFLFLVLLVAGCSPAENNSLPRLVLHETVIYPENEPPYIKIKSGDGFEMISEVDEYPSLPQISEDQRKMAYISPFEFDMLGHVWLYEAERGDKRRIVTPDQEENGAISARRVLWLATTTC